MGAVWALTVVKFVTLFLVVIVVLAMFGKLGWLGSLAPTSLRRPKLRGKPVTCLHCGKHLIGRSGCDCTKSQKNKG